MRAAVYVWLLVCVCTLIGCGYKTNPRPALAKIPGPVAEPDARVFPGRVVLKWHKPPSNTDGSSFDDLSGYKVYRFVQKIGEECEHCDERRTLYANIDADQPINAVIKAGDVTFTDKSLEPGNVHLYAVLAYNLKGREGQASRNVPVTVDVPPPAVERLRAEIEQKGVVLGWDAPPKVDTITGYRIYRGDSQDPEEMTPIGTSAGLETGFTDPNVEKEKTYHYAVRSLKTVGRVPVESLSSPAVKMTIPRIRWSAPQGISVISSSNGITIGWNAVQVPNDETRYNIYRSESGKAFEKINAEPLNSAKFTDGKVTKGLKYRYAVTACPAKSPEDESARSASEMVEFRP